MTETFLMASRAADRLQSDSDTDFAAVFKRIFNIDKTDATLFSSLQTTKPVKQELALFLNCEDFVHGMFYILTG